MSQTVDSPSAEEVIEENRDLFESLAEGDDGVAAAAEQLLAEVGNE
jgi:hypothetical protein